MIPEASIHALRDELLHIIKQAQEEKVAVGALGKLVPGKLRPTPVPRVNLPVPKVV